MNLILLKRLFYEKLIKSGSIVIKIILIQNRYIEIHSWNCKICIFAKKKCHINASFFSIVRKRVVCIQLGATSLFKIRVLSRKKGSIFLKCCWNMKYFLFKSSNRKPLWHYYIIIHILVVSVCNLCMHWSEMVIMYFSYIILKIMKVKFCKIRCLKFKYFEEWTPWTLE